eukprot:8770293-Pyramimonas_sp.AAC.2
MPVDPSHSPRVSRQVQSEWQQAPRLGRFGLQLRVFPGARPAQGEPFRCNFRVRAMQPVVFSQLRFQLLEPKCMFF